MVCYLCFQSKGEGKGQGGAGVPAAALQEVGAIRSSSFVMWHARMVNVAYYSCRQGWAWFECVHAGRVFLSSFRISSFSHGCCCDLNLFRFSCVMLCVCLFLFTLYLRRSSATFTRAALAAFASPATSTQRAWPGPASTARPRVAAAPAAAVAAAAPRTGTGVEVERGGRCLTGEMVAAKAETTTTAMAIQTRGIGPR